LDLTPSLRAQGWLVLLALSSQALGWLVIAVSLPRLPAAVTSVLLTFQPVLSVLFAAAILGESPSALQLLGVVGVPAGPLPASSGSSTSTPRRPSGSRPACPSSTASSAAASSPRRSSSSAASPAWGSRRFC